MPTSDEYAKLLELGLAPGEVVRVSCESSREYNAQRMTFYRALKRTKTLGFDVSRVTSRKVVSEAGIILEIENKLPGSTTFLSKKLGETEFKQITLDDKADQSEEEEFKKWQESIKTGD